MSSFPIQKDTLDAREDMVVADDQNGLTARFQDKSVADLDTDSIEAGWEDLLKDSFGELDVTPDQGITVDSDEFLQAIVSGRDDITQEKEAAVCLCYLEEEGALSLEGGKVQLVPGNLNNVEYPPEMSYNLIAYLEAKVDRWSRIIEQYDKQLENLDELIEGISQGGVEKMEKITELEGEIKELCGELIPPKSAEAADSVSNNELGLSYIIEVPEEVENSLSDEEIKQYKINWDGIIGLKRKEGDFGDIKLGQNTFELLMSLKTRAEVRVDGLKNQIPQLREQIALSAISFEDAVEGVSLEELMIEQAEVKDYYDEFEKTVENDIEEPNDIIETYKQGQKAKATIEENEEVEIDDDIGGLSSSPMG